MPIAVVQGAVCKCTYGSRPAELRVPVRDLISIHKIPAATIKDSLPEVNVQPFGDCKCWTMPFLRFSRFGSMMGALRAGRMFLPKWWRIPCHPHITGPWIPQKPMIRINDVPILDAGAILRCRWGGIISIIYPGQVICDLRVNV